MPTWAFNGDPARAFWAGWCAAALLLTVFRFQIALFVGDHAQGLVIIGLDGMARLSWTLWKCWMAGLLLTGVAYLAVSYGGEWSLGKRRRLQSRLSAAMFSALACFVAALALLAMLGLKVSSGWDLVWGVLAAYLLGLAFGGSAAPESSPGL